MITVTAKKLRTNLSEYLDRLQSGEEVFIIRHSEVVGSLRPVQNNIKGNGAAIAAMLNRNKKSFALNKGLTDENKTAKELYSEALDKRNS
jgi:antitoxin (DNA-binding transcriptional repressor) of toxin-antitoxin stability system